MVVAVFFYFHGELNVFVKTIEVFQEDCQTLFPMWPDDESVINVSVPAGGLESGLV